MEKERESFITHYTELSDFITPRRGRFFQSDRNKGTKVHNNIINSTATKALQVARSGMLAGSMSPSRPWFDMEVPDPDLMEVEAVKVWLSEVVRRMRAIFNRGNLYGQASVMLGELLTFGTGMILHVDDFDDVARFYAQTVGSYYIGQNNRFEVDTIAREFEWTIIQIVKEFGLENTSTFVRTAFDKGNYDQWAPVVHFIEPNENTKPDAIMPKNFPFSSVYFEPGNQGPDREKFLRESGFRRFPAYVTRWDVTGEDIYGTDCPGMTALGDVKALQTEEREKAKSIEKMVSPPLSGPPSLRNVPVNTLPGGLTIYSGTQQQRLEPIYQPVAPINELRVDMQHVEQRINQAFFVDLFLAISNMEGIQPRNQLDIASRNEERLLQLGPVLERLHGEFLEPLIDRTFDDALAAGVFPPPPPELSGADLRVKFISNLAIAQRAVVTADLDRILAATAGAVAVDPSAAMKFDGKQWLDEYGRALGLPPKVLRADAAGAELEKKQAEQAQQAAAMASMQGMAGAAKDLAAADTEGKNALTDLAAQQEE
jgi:hypothetical protein